MKHDLKHTDHGMMKEIHLTVYLAAFVLLSGCSVVKTPYFLTSYYKTTMSVLDAEEKTVTIIKDSLRAGFSRVSITPGPQMISGIKHKSRGVPVAGFGRLKTKYATGVHDSIFVRAVALRTGDQTRYLVSADLLLMPPDIIDTVTQRLEKSGIRRDQLFFTATHTHSSLGGWGYGLLSRVVAGRKDPWLKKWITDKIELAVLNASADLLPASAGTGEFRAPQFTTNRLTHLQEQINPFFNFLAIKRDDGKKALIGTYSAHATTAGSRNTLLSGDYPGAWEKRLETSGFSVAMFCGGSMANQSPYGEGEVFESGEFIGGSLADSVLSNQGRINIENMALLTSLSVNLSLPPYRVRISKNCTLPTGLSKLMMPVPTNVLVQALRINNLIWFFTPGDFSGESAMLLKKILLGKGLQTAVSGYNGDYIGYILPGKYFYLKHYETRAMSWFGPTLGDYMTEIMEQMSNILTR